MKHLANSSDSQLPLPSPLSRPCALAPRRRRGSPMADPSSSSSQPPLPLADLRVLPSNLTSPAALYVLAPPVTPSPYRDALLLPAAATPSMACVPDTTDATARPRLRSIISVPSHPPTRSGGIDASLAPPGIDGGSVRLVGRGGWPVTNPRPPRPPLQHLPSPPSLLKALLLRKAWGKCFRCLRKGHRIADCRGKARCLLCGSTGHKARRCPPSTTPKPTAPRASAPAMSLPPLPPGPPPPCAVRLQEPVRRDMKAPAADVESRRGLIVATAPRSAMLADVECNLYRNAVVATIVGHRPWRCGSGSIWRR